MKNLNVNKENLEELDNVKLNQDESKKLTGYATIDRPWMKWYQEEVKPLTKGVNAYDYFLYETKDYDFPLLEYYGKKYTRKDIEKEVEDKIKKLTSMGIQQGDMVSFVFLNVPEAIFFWFALSKMGAAANLIKFDESPERIKYMCELAESKFLFISEVPFIVDNVIKSVELGNHLEQIITVPVTESMPKVAVLNMLYEDSKKEAFKEQSPFATLKAMKKMYINTMAEQNKLKDKIKDQPGFVFCDEWKKEYDGKEMNTIVGGGDKTSVVMYTGGTTGGAKGVMTTNDAFSASAHIFKTSEMEFFPGKTSMSILPPAVSYYFNATYCLMCSGVSVNLISKFAVEEYPDLIKKHRPNVYMAGPILFKAIRESGIEDLSFSTDPISGGDKLHEEEEYAYHDFSKEHGCDSWIKQGYGMTETMAGIVYSIRPALKVGSIGIPLKHCEVGIFDFVPYDEFDPNTLEEKKYGEIGEICYTGPTVMKGYLNNPEATNAMVRIHKDGKLWVHTDDLGYMDEDGRLYHQGRAKRMLTRNGGKVWLGTVENVIKGHDAVDDCCCVKLDDPVEREVPVAHIVLKDENVDNSVFDEIDELVRQNCPETFIPKYYVKTDEIPITEVNKKVNFKALESLDILNTDNYKIDGRVIAPKNKVKKLV